MEIFFDLFGSAISCVLYGGFIAIIITVGLYIVLSSINKESTHSYLFFLSLGLLFVVLFINMSIMTGAIKVKNMANKSLTTIEQFHHVINSTNLNELGRSITDGNYIDVIQQLGHASGNLDINNVQELKKQLENNWSLLRLYFSSSDMSPSMLLLSPTRTIERFNSRMNSVILSNVLWSMAFLMLTIIVAIYNVKKTGKPTSSKSTYSSHRMNRYDEEF